MPPLPPRDAAAVARGLRVPQARVLHVLSGGGLLTRAKLCARAGFSPIAGTITSALNGRAPGRFGPGYRGLVGLGLVVAEELDVDGATETVYRATPFGRAVAAALPDGTATRPLKDKAQSTNTRYKARRETADAVEPTDT